MVTKYHSDHSATGKSNGAYHSSHIGKDGEFPKESSPREPICEEDPYPHYPRGKYDAECINAITFRHPLLGAWKCRFKFQLVGVGYDTSHVVYQFLHLGMGKEPKAGRWSKYTQAWVIANGRPAKKRQRLSSRVFKGKIFQVEIDYVQRSFKGIAHPDGQIYSVVKDILKKLP